LTATIVAISLVISYVLFHLGIYFFFLPIIFFIPLVRFSEVDNVHMYVNQLHQRTTVLDLVHDLMYVDFCLEITITM
jgi:hypothetical protein